MKAIQMPLWKIIFVRDPPKKTPVMPGLFCDGANHALRDFRDIGRLWAFLALNNFELNSIAFGKGLESRADIALKWTNTSGPPSLEMKPKPFASLNHFTVPVMRAMTDPFPKRES